MKTLGCVKLELRNLVQSLPFTDMEVEAGKGPSSPVVTQLPWDQVLPFRARVILVPMTLSPQELNETVKDGGHQQATVFTVGKGCVCG